MLARVVIVAIRTLVGRAVLKISQTQVEQIQGPVKRAEVEQTLQAETLITEASKSTEWSILGAGRLAVNKAPELVKSTGQEGTMDQDRVGVVRA